MTIASNYYPLTEEDCHRILSATVVAIVKHPLTVEQLESWMGFSGRMADFGVTSKQVDHALTQSIKTVKNQG